MVLPKQKGQSAVTRYVVNCFNTMSEQEFFNKFSVGKAKYLKRFMKYGDPYMKSNLAKIGKLFS